MKTGFNEMPIEIKGAKYNLPKQILLNLPPLHNTKERKRKIMDDFKKLIYMIR
jgi:hypothetical protein